jgi:hypothetical protein
MSEGCRYCSGRVPVTLCEGNEFPRGEGGLTEVLKEREGGGWS